MRRRPCIKMASAAGGRHVGGLGDTPGAAAPRRIQKLNRRKLDFAPRADQIGLFLLCGTPGGHPRVPRAANRLAPVTRARRAGPSPAGTARKIAKLRAWHFCRFSTCGPASQAAFQRSAGRVVTRARRAGPSPPGTARKDWQLRKFWFSRLCGAAPLCWPRSFGPRFSLRRLPRRVGRFSALRTAAG